MRVGQHWRWDKCVRYGKARKLHGRGVQGATITLGMRPVRSGRALESPR